MRGTSWSAVVAATVIRRRTSSRLDKLTKPKHQIVNLFGPCKMIGDRRHPAVRAAAVGRETTPQGACCGA